MFFLSVRVWIEDSFKEYTRLLYSTDAEEAGASLTSGYFGLSRTEQIEVSGNWESK